MSSGGDVDVRERTLVISIDGLAPRVITPTTMPNLCGLARSGGSCFTARTVDPPITVPAHASMFRGVAPDVHGLVDNTPIPPAGEAGSFLAVARAGGRTTASVLCWLPLDQLIEPTASRHRVTIDAGYDPHDDDVVTLETIDLLRRERPDVTLTYLVGTDLAGHASGWASDDYLAAATRVDELLGGLFAAAGSEAAIVVTTDHGGVGRNHVDPVPDTLETFVVVRSRRVAPGSMWQEASILDIAPTVADLAGVPPAPEWVGASLIGTQRPIVDHLLGLVAAMADHAYGERVDMLQHSLQTAACARADGAPDELVLAALLHDVGHVLGEAGAWGLPDHAEVGARYLQQWLPPGVVEPIRLHVAAKRYLVASDPAYLGQLSHASVESLREQGGPFDSAEVADFATNSYSTAATALRRHDDDGKVTGLDVQPLDHYREPLTAALTGRPAGADPTAISPMWARDACRCADCRHPRNGQHLIDVTELSGWRVASVADQGDVLIVELEGAAGDGRSHRCVIPHHDTTRDRLPITHWATGHRQHLVDHSAPATTDAMLDRFACELAEYGIALATGLPTTPGTILDFVSRVGFVRATNYGELFDVVADPNPTNLAYTAIGLPLHTDNPYRDPVPTVQFLHCLRAAEGGGGSMFGDGFHAAEQLRARHPDDFAVLTTTPVEFRYADDSVDLRASVPLIQLDAAQRVVRVTVNHRSMEPLAGEYDGERFYAAYQRFAEILADPANTIEITLRAGELIGFDNRRVLHGRRGYDSDPHRHLQGCYLDIDAIRARAQRARSLG